VRPVRGGSVGGDGCGGQPLDDSQEVALERLELRLHLLLALLLVCHVYRGGGVLLRLQGPFQLLQLTILFQERLAEPRLDVLLKSEELLLVSLLDSSHPEDFVHSARLAATNLELLVALLHHCSAVSFVQILWRKCIEGGTIRAVDEVTKTDEIIGGILNRDIDDLLVAPIVLLDDVEHLGAEAPPLEGRQHQHLADAGPNVGGVGVVLVDGGVPGEGVPRLAAVGVFEALVDDEEPPVGVVKVDVGGGVDVEEDPGLMRSWYSLKPLSLPSHA